METDDFLNEDQMVKLTGRRRKSRQIEWLKAEGIPFRVSATGHPSVTWSAANGQQRKAEPAKGWQPRVVAA
jgi:hypothetical protein